MTTLAILPVKRLDQAKFRLAPALGADQRRVLAEAMASDVLEALRRVRNLAGVVAVAAGPEARALAAAQDVEVIADMAGAGQSAAVGLGIAWARTHGAHRALLVPGDCPVLDPQEIDALLAEDTGRAPAAVVVPDRHSTGTNALLLSPPDLLNASFGPGSFARHLDAIRAIGVEPMVRRPASLALDVDTPDDLAALRELLASRDGMARRTRAALEHVACAL